MKVEFSQDKKRYSELSSSSVYKEPAMFLVLLFRICQKINNIDIKLIRFTLNIFYIPFYKFTSIFLGISLPRKTKIDAGFVIFHYGAIAINELTQIGKNCTIRQGVTIGNKNTADDVPILGDNVDIGAGAVIIGRIKIGNNVSIGANAVVLKDVPDNNIAIGVPAINMAKKLGKEYLETV